MGLFISKKLNYILGNLKKFIYFYSNDEDYDYLLVRGTTTTLDYFVDETDLMILQHFLIKVAQEIEMKEDEIKAQIASPYGFSTWVKSALGWSREKRQALIFKYVPTQETIEYKEKYDKAKREYKLIQSDENYDKLEIAFYDFWNSLE